MLRKKVALVWLKRDFRISDHEPFAEAIKTGLPIYAFYLYEPELLLQADVDIRHIQFIKESIKSVNHKMIHFHACIHSHTCSAIDFFSQLIHHHEIGFVFSHQETGNLASFNRDLLVSKFFKARAIEWKEFKPSYIVRGLRSGRMAWKEKWKSWMEELTHEPNWNQAKERNIFINEPLNLTCSMEIRNKLNSKFQKSLETENQFQIGGLEEAEKNFQSFIKSRYKKYSACISKPEESRTHCSRLSPYLAFGVLSAKQVYKETKKERENTNYFGKRQFDRFLSRLAWRDHMIQKFESECRIEFENFNAGYDLIQHQRRDDLIKAWEAGRTGFPLIDASMRCLIATGYLNFRMRAMLVSFLTMILWQDWRWGVHFMARQFLDYEPGIHYFQFQMQASTVGNHQIRIYNPYKQILDNDPNCFFIKKWIPELRKTSIPDIHTWGIESPGLFSVKIDYPKPIVDFKTSYNHARDIMFTQQSSPEVQKNLNKIRKMHIVDRRKQFFR
jgi:deoxyribodipyrimidine photo-lyase